VRLDLLGCEPRLASAVLTPLHRGFQLGQHQVRRRHRRHVVGAQQRDSEPMNFCRRKCQEMFGTARVWRREMWLQVEDLQRSIYVYKNKFKKKFRQLAGK
jgi:hypothetical protein